LIDVLTQIRSPHAALDKVVLGLLGDHTHLCVMKAKASDRDQRAAELTAAVARLLRRSWSVNLGAGHWSLSDMPNPKASALHTADLERRAIEVNLVLGATRRKIKAAAAVPGFTMQPPCFPLWSLA
jgi:hypothetical protein